MEHHVVDSYMKIMLTIKLSAGTINCRGRDPIEILRCQLLLINGLGHNKKYTSRLQAYSQKIKLSVDHNKKINVPLSRRLGEFLQPLLRPYPHWEI